MRSVRDRDLMTRLGADHVLLAGHADLPARLTDVVGDYGADVVIDMVGGPGLADVLAGCAVGARVVNVGRLGGGTFVIDLDHLALQQISLVGVTFRTRTADQKATVVEGMVRDLVPQWRSTPCVH
ncbi:MAG: zinc-binding dehydrogenase [Flavobacterium sp.]|nr:zinc-binding dehydrogenase [Aeromicrobium sp.]